MNIPEATFLAALALSSPLWLAVLIGKIRTRRKTKREAQEQAAHETHLKVLEQAYEWGYADGHLEAILEQDPNYTPKPSPFSLFHN
jgi:hypothetical protein